MNQRERIINRFKEIEDESQVLTREFKQAEMLYYMADSDSMRDEIERNINDIKHKLSQLELEYENVSEVVNTIIDLGVAI